MKKNFLLLVLLMLTIAWQSATAQQRRPIDSQHPLWLIHIDVWNSADPQKIIDLIPEDIKPYVCMNLSLSCQFDTNTSMYRMPRNAVRTYKSWASVCQLNNMWFSCQPASGGHTHIQDNDLETFEYFFKTYPDIYSKIDDLPPAKYNVGVSVKNSLVASGSIINGTVEDSVIFKKVFVGNNCTIKNSIILNDVYIGDNTYIENCIVEARGTIRANSSHKGEDGIKIVVEKNERYVI